MPVCVAATSSRPVNNRTTNNHQPSTNNHQPSTINQQPSTINHQLTTIIMN
ncbi:MAG: hypothetical protein VKN72_19500 [Nostocales cyanobacterium 94392]|nr:hypothetical protein [Nostocales cyanobacterium 94392]